MSYPMHSDREERVDHYLQVEEADTLVDTQWEAITITTLCMATA